MKQKQKDSETPSNRARTILQNIHKQGLASNMIYLNFRLFGFYSRFD